MSADPLGKEADAHMVDDAYGLAIKDGADLEVALEFTKGLFDFEKVFVVALDVCGVGPVVEVFVGIELLEGTSGLAGDFLVVGLGALGGGGELGESPGAPCS